jgi:hypothetical protein
MRYLRSGCHLRFRRRKLNSVQVTAFSVCEVFNKTIIYVSIHVCFREDSFDVKLYLLKEMITRTEALLMTTLPLEVPQENRRSVASSVHCSDLEMSIPYMHRTQDSELLH